MASSGEVVWDEELSLPLNGNSCLRFIQLVCNLMSYLSIDQCMKLKMAIEEVLHIALRFHHHYQNSILLWVRILDILNSFTIKLFTLLESSYLINSNATQ